MDGGASAKLSALFPSFGGRYYRNNNLRRHDQTLGLGVFRRFRWLLLNRERPVRVVNNHWRCFDLLRGILRASRRGGCKGKNRQ